MHQIARIAGYFRMLTMDDDIPRLGRQTHLIDEGDLEKERRDVMVSIGSASMYCQNEIYFGRCKLHHHRQSYHIRGSVSASGAGRSSIFTWAVPTGTRMRKSAWVRPAVSCTSL